MTSNASSQPWPPPPDLDSIQELVATADIEGFIAKGAPADEYETEAELLFNQLENALAQQIARFFGPEAQPQVRGS